MRTTFGRVVRHLRNKYSRNFVFIHINKTAGCSIERALNLPTEHKTALQKIEQLGRHRWDRRFTFAVVRNPWDKVVSQYHYRLERNKTGIATEGIGFADWVRLTYGERDRVYIDPPGDFRPQIDWIADSNGDILVKFVARYENLEHDFRIICDQLKRETELPHLNESSRGPYRDYYDGDSEEIIAQYFRRDIDAFGYAF